MCQAHVRQAILYMSYEFEQAITLAPSGIAVDILLVKLSPVYNVSSGYHIFTSGLCICSKGWNEHSHKPLLSFQ